MNDAQGVVVKQDSTYRPDGRSTYSLSVWTDWTDYTVIAWPNKRRVTSRRDREGQFGGWTSD